EEADVLQLNLVAVDAGDLGDMGNDATSVAQPGLLHQEGDAAHDLFADGLEWQVRAAHDDHGLDPVDRVLGAVGVHGGHAAVVTRVHRLQHVQRFGGAAFADDDAVSAHTESIDNQVADRDRAPALDGGGGGF